jgi:hypothetical protein
LTARNVALVAISFLVLALPGSAHATFPGANGKIAFVRGNDVWTMDPDGSNQVDITNTPSAGEERPAWSADGRQIAYVRGGAIWKMNADGTLQTQVVPGPTTSGCGYADALGDPAWSPSGSKIAFHRSSCRRDPDGGEIPFYDLYTVNPDGTGQGLLHIDGRSPRWSPDGTKVGYTSFADGGGWSVPRWTTPDGSSDFGIYDDGFVEDDVLIDWSPDGLLVDGSGERLCSPSCFEAYTIHPDGTGYTVRPNGVGRWSPDGTKFVTSGVYTMNVDGSNKTQVASSGTSPDWQPVTTNYVRPKGASPFQTYLVPAYTPCAAPNRTHGSPLAFPSCSPPTQSSANLTLGTPDSNGQPANGLASVFLATRVGDLKTVVTIRDVRKASDLSDYTGQLDVQTDLRITDRNNTPSPGPATATDSPLRVPVSCTATGSTTLGSDCNLTTTVNSLYPGAISAGQRAVWELGQVKAYDGGVDGLASTTADNTLFLTEGIFIP